MTKVFIVSNASGLFLNSTKTAFNVRQVATPHFPSKESAQAWIETEGQKIRTLSGNVHRMRIYGQEKKAN